MKTLLACALSALAAFAACAKPPTWYGAWRQIEDPRPAPEPSTARDPLVRGIVNSFHQLSPRPTELTIPAVTEGGAEGGAEVLIPDDTPRVDRDGRRLDLPKLRVRHVGAGRIEVSGGGVEAFPIDVYLDETGQRLTLCPSAHEATPPLAVGWLFAWQDGHTRCDLATDGWTRIPSPSAE